MTRYRLPLILLVFAAVLFPAAADAQLGFDEDGFTILNLPPASRRVYVSSSTGLDSNPGTMSQPVQTLNAAINKVGFVSHSAVLLKKGDTWNESFGSINKHGLSADQPLIFTSYGDGARPRIITGNNDGIAFESFGAAPFTGIAIKGLHFDATGRDPNPGGDHAGLLFNTSGNGILVEDNLFERYATNIIMQNSKTSETLANVDIRRNIIADAYRANSTTGTNGSNGLYIDNVSDVLVEGNIFDHNGFNESVPDADPTIYNHNLYIQGNTDDVRVIDNILARGSAHGVEARSGGIFKGNVAIENGIALRIGTGKPAYIDANVSIAASLRFLEGGSFPGPRGFGLSVSDQSVARIYRNLQLHSPDGATRPFEVGANAITGTNITWQWGSISDPLDPAWPDPSRTVGSYDALLGGAGTIDSFLTGARTLSADNWQTQYTAPELAAYLRQGFAIIPEPGTLAILGLAGMIVGLRRRRG